MRKSRPIKTKPNWGPVQSNLTLSGWYDGRDTYLWIGKGEECLGGLHGMALYRLAKTIVKEFEKT